MTRSPITILLAAVAGCTTAYDVGSMDAGRVDTLDVPLPDARDIGPDVPRDAWWIRDVPPFPPDVPLDGGRPDIGPWDAGPLVPVQLTAVGPADGRILVGTCRSTGAECVIVGSDMPCALMCPLGDEVDICCSNGSRDGCWVGRDVAPEGKRIDEVHVTGHAATTCPTPPAGPTLPVVRCSATVGATPLAIECGFFDPRGP